ncbi:MAG: dihydropteroate synthase [Lachnospiraceae bacterium]|nr:dihydropteroate synthase [Lachnospiraceae bacterium]
MQIGNRSFYKGHTCIMGILNVTPDSFSDGGSFNELDKALFHVEEMVKEGADIVDLGGESTRPGYTLLSEEEEINRVLPYIEKIKSRFDIPVSLDTYKWKVAEAGLAAGIDLVNDIWGLQYDQGEMAALIARHKVPSCLMHNRKEAVYQNYMEDVCCDLKRTLEIAKRAGIEKDSIILDPGVGFAKSYEQNLEVIQKLDQICDLGYPVLLGCSRKSVIGLTLDLPVTERLEGTLATTAMGVLRGAAFVRVHDVKENVRFVKMLEKMLEVR